VDDDPVSRRLAVRALEKIPSDPEVFSAENGPEALDLVQKIKPDVVVLDLMMPGMSGLDVCRALRQNLQSAFLPILMLTGSDRDDDRLQGYLLGTDDYMQKPFSMAELHARVSRLLQRTYGR
jgi:two-component system sensor histidine kinase ChiS